MKIEHIAIWVRDIEAMKDFYCKYFDAIANNKYINDTKGFCSYFISFNSSSRLEIMHSKSMDNLNFQNSFQKFGLIHFAISVGSREKVNKLTAQLKNDGYKVVEQPRTTGDRYYESIILDPENNQIEITI
ncbi:lactoylglutathione lyase [Francisella halioticida]|uniref:Glyoxalase/bleomycin resistance/extradiol dioxygenase family protein n=1 Tax=Francisella halioticida TaxID=549298 RepID=A0ABN5AUX2_9GAMM|nr:VOC family protein [Francisella halioticida]ASG67344.1 glyoxalase/bleomycin resistance/extradiol dioxygenase family protein [Francisella halioticida]BCD92509.1 lactoylglutathione lyase [Francisella halioticida]